ncbi:MAG: phenylacetate--CoA ligase family protein [Bradyrhizobiaceae bacterium]|nr:phenylacetate--CoA ligase family protein [Bradyrhizobiaceae bacterium]
MSEFYDQLETRDPTERERDLLARLPGLIGAALKAPGWKKHLGDVDPRAITSREALAKLPVFRKSDLPALLKGDPPFASLLPEPVASYARFSVSPGPVFQPEVDGSDPWRVARGIFAAGIRKGDIVLNTFAYHLTPGGFMLDLAARALGCPVIAAGPGNTDHQLAVIEQLNPVAYTGTPDFLKILRDAWIAAGKGAFPIRKAVVSGAAFPPSLQAEVKSWGIDAYQTYAVGDLGLVAYETPAREGMIVCEDVLLEIVKPGTGDPVADGEVGEVVLTSFDVRRPWVRLAVGDLSAVLAGRSPCGRTNARIKGWMGRADQTTKIKGMFVRPEQVAEIARRHPELARLRLVVTREGETDAMTLRAEAASREAAQADRIAETLQAITKLKGKVELVAAGSLPNDGKVIADERSYQ